MNKHNILAIVVGIILTVLIVFLCLNTGRIHDDGAQEASTEYLSDEIVVHYSDGYNDEGYLEGVKASDYVTLCDYAHISVPKDIVEATEDDVDKEIAELLSDSGFGIYEGVVKDGDTVNIDYIGSIDGEEFSGGSATGENLEIGSGTFIDTFEEQLIGHEVGESFDVEVTFPTDYASEDIAGKVATFNVLIHYIQPVLDDEFVEKNFFESEGIDTVEALKDKIRENFRVKREGEYIWNYLMSNCSFTELPEELVEKRLDVALDSLRKQYHDYMGYNDDQIVQMYELNDISEVREQLRPDTEELIKTSLISMAIADEQGLSVSEESMKQYLGEESVDSYCDTYGMPYVASKVLITLVSDYLLENAVLN